MHETTFSFSQLESPGPSQSLPAGRHTLRGWVWPRSGPAFVDVRARVGRRIFPGVHGIPRADLAAHFQTGRPFALAEFMVVVELDPGAAKVELDVLEITGHWRTFQSASFAVEASASPADVALPAGPLRWIDYGHGFHQLLRESARQPDVALSILAGRLVNELPWPRVLRDVPAPLIGFVDEPAAECCCRFGRMPAFGHLFHPHLRTRRVLGTVDLQSWQALPMRLPSPGPAAFYPQHENARDCGFAGLVDVPAQLPNPVSLRIYVELEDGSLQLGPVVRSRLHTGEDEKLPARLEPPQTFESALAAWDAALAARHLAVTRDGDLDRFLAGLRTELPHTPRRRAPAAIGPLIESPEHSTAALPRRVLVTTHGLSRQGAPRFLLEYCRALSAAGVQLQVVSAEDGPLRAEFARLGAEVSLFDAGRLSATGSAEQAGAVLRDLARQPGWTSADLVVANSFTTFWAVHAAKAAGRPVLMYVHESTTPTAFYGSRVPPWIVALAEEAFALADAVSFTTAATRAYHLGYGRPERHRLTAGWADVAALDRWLARQDREALRRELGIRPGELLVCNIGTVSDRKGQHTFARAIDLLWHYHPELAGRTKFILLGGRDSPFDAMLGEALAELGRANIIVHPETSDYLRYYLAADVFACSSYEESSPLVVFEAMACRAPIIASAVHGIPELVRPGVEARLLPAGDTEAWCEGLATMLTDPDGNRQLAHRARARLESHFAATAVLPRHLALAREVAAGMPGHFT